MGGIFSSLKSNKEGEKGDGQNSSRKNSSSDQTKKTPSKESESPEKTPPKTDGDETVKTEVKGEKEVEETLVNAMSKVTLEAKPKNQEHQKTEEPKKVVEEPKKVTEEVKKVTEEPKKVDEEPKKVTEEAKKETEKEKTPVKVPASETVSNSTADSSPVVIPTLSPPCKLPEMTVEKLPVSEQEQEDNTPKVSTNEEKADNSPAPAVPNDNAAQEDEAKPETGGMSEFRAVDPNITRVVEKVYEEIKEHAKKFIGEDVSEPINLELIGYRMNIVLGYMYFAKLKIPGDSFVQAKILETPSGDINLQSVMETKTEEDERDYFKLPNLKK